MGAEVEEKSIAERNIILFEQGGYIVQISIYKSHSGIMCKIIWRFKIGARVFS